MHDALKYKRFVISKLAMNNGGYFYMSDDS